MDLKETMVALQYSGDRAGMLMCGDVNVGLNMILKDDPNFSGVKVESADPVLQALKMRDDLRAMLNFALSDEFFRLRSRIGDAVP